MLYPRPPKKRIGVFSANNLELRGGLTVVLPFSSCLDAFIAPVIVVAEYCITSPGISKNIYLIKKKNLHKL